MISIISETGDVSSNEVIEYLLSFKKDFKRYNVENQSLFTISINNNTLNLPFKNTFHRRARLNTLSNDQKNSIFRDYLKNEENPVIKSLEYIAKKENHNYVGEYNDEEQHNKIIDLYIAKNAGLKIPKTIVSNKQSDIQDFFYDCEKKIITKCIKYPLNIRLQNSSIVGKNTFFVKQKDIKTLTQINSLGIYQEYIEKQVEIRAFFYKDKIFPMAIFSQQNKKTKIDYREYDEENPNRYVPYKLPINIEEKIRLFCVNKNINTGSIDIILDHKDNYIFLENNPQGQFEWVSKSCNYYIEKFIAEDLVNHEEESVINLFKKQ